MKAATHVPIASRFVSRSLNLDSGQAAGRFRTPKALDAIVKGVEREAKRALSATSETGAIDKQLLEERRKLQNLVSAIEAEGVSAGSLVSAVTTRERNIAALEARLRQARTTPTSAS